MEDLPLRLRPPTCDQASCALKLLLISCTYVRSHTSCWCRLWAVGKMACLKCTASRRTLFGAEPASQVRQQRTAALVLCTCHRLFVPAQGPCCSGHLPLACREARARRPAVRLRVRMVPSLRRLLCAAVPVSAGLCSSVHKATAGTGTRRGLGAGRAGGGATFPAAHRGDHIARTHVWVIRLGLDGARRGGPA